MKAILMTAAGGPEVLQLADIPVPELPSPSHIRVRLCAAGVNPVDTKRRAPKDLVETTPKILGFDASGTVEAVGPEVTLFKPGDRLIRMPEGRHSDLRKQPGYEAALREILTTPATDGG